MGDDPMDVVVDEVVSEMHDVCYGEWNDTLGLPEELMVHLLALLPPKSRVLSSLVSTTWRRLIQEAWKLSYGDITPSLAFHSLMTGKILRQCIPHVTWTVPFLANLPVNVPVYSPTFEQDHSPASAPRTLSTTWRLKLLRLPPHTSPEQPDLILSAELLKLPLYLTASDNPRRVHVFHYGRAENPASYSWAEFHTGQAKIEPGQSVQLLTGDIQHLTSNGGGFYSPPAFNCVQFKAMLARGDVEHVAVFTEDDSTRNRGSDLFLPSTNTIVLHMETDWLKGSQADSQRKLKKALQTIRPNWDLTYKEFWRVIMRRNHSFRPVSKELRSYESPFYAVYAIDVHPSDNEKICLFFKFFDGTQLQYVGKKFGGPGHTLRGILKDYDLNHHTLFEEVHSRRLDKIESCDTSMGAMELGSGDVVVICPRGCEDDLFNHYKTLVFTSTLVTIQPNMWHT
jgi:hypothetical protein